MNNQEILKSLKEINEQIPEFTFEEIHEIMNFESEHTVELDVSKPLQKIIVILKSLILEFVNVEILHNDAGFVQKDNTYALYRYKYETLKNMHLENFPIHIQKQIFEKALLILLSTLQGLEQKC